MPTKLCRPKLAAIAKKCVHRVYWVYKMDKVYRVNKILDVYRVYLSTPGCSLHSVHGVLLIQGAQSVGSKARKWSRFWLESVKKLNSWSRHVSLQHLNVMPQKRLEAKTLLSQFGQLIYHTRQS